MTGRLAAEPYLWAADGMLWPLIPDAVRLWSVERARRVGERDADDLASLPDPRHLDHQATYLIDLVRA